MHYFSLPCIPSELCCLELSISLSFVAPEEANAIRRDLSEATKARTEAVGAMRGTKGELDGVLSMKRDLEASPLKEQESYHTLRNDLQGSKDREGTLGRELDALIQKLAQQTSLAQEHEGKVARLQKDNKEVSS